MKRNFRHFICSVATLALTATALPAMAAVPCTTGPRAVIAQGAGPPPPLRREVQPIMPAYGYAWPPGYWAWNDTGYDYYWVSGVWARPPGIGMLWTPPWWGWVGGVYAFTPGYWGQNVGFYGGIRYGYGYGGQGYDGGYWNGRTFYCNRAVNNFGGVHVNAVYNRAWSAGRGYDGVSYNGGRGGVRASASMNELSAARQARSSTTTYQSNRARNAMSDPGNRAAANRGHAGAIAAGVAAGAVAGHVAMRAASNHASSRGRAGIVTYHTSRGGHAISSHGNSFHSNGGYRAGGGSHGGGARSSGGHGGGSYGGGSYGGGGGGHGGGGGGGGHGGGGGGGGHGGGGGGRHP